MRISSWLDSGTSFQEKSSCSEEESYVLNHRWATPRYITENFLVSLPVASWCLRTQDAPCPTTRGPATGDLQLPMTMPPFSLWERLTTSGWFPCPGKSHSYTCLKTYDARFIWSLVTLFLRKFLCLLAHWLFGKDNIRQWSQNIWFLNIALLFKRRRKLCVSLYLNLLI